MSLRDAFTRYPSRITAPFEEYLDEGRDQDTQHRQWAEILPAYQPVEAGPIAGHQLDVVSESEMRRDVKFDL